MINYSPNSTWIDYDVSRPVSAARLNRLETGVMDAHWENTVRAYLSTNATVTNGSWQTLTFGTQKWNNGAQWTSGAGSRMTAQLTGIYQFGANVEFAANATGDRGLRVVVNSAGATQLVAKQFVRAAGTFETTLNVSGDWAMLQNAYLECQVFQNSGAALALNNTVGVSKEFWFRHGTATF